jgi:hypothetical protein
VFFFTSLAPKTTNLSSERIFVLGGFQVLRRFVGFLVAMDWFNKVSRVFSRFFGQK